MSDLRSVLMNPFWLPHRILDQNAIRFVHVGRELHRKATFLDDSSLERTSAELTFALEAIDPVAIEDGPLHFIFHSAFARSTLLARALDLPGVAMGLKEPIILNDATQLSRQRQLSPHLLERILQLLARPFAPGESVIVKPSNAANLLMDRMLQLRPRSRALLLYRDLADYLRSIARKGMFGRIWARNQLHQIRHEATFTAGFSEVELFAQTDLQAAAYGWLIQLGQFARLAENFPERVRLMDAAALVAEPRAAFKMATSWFELEIDDVQIDHLLSSGVFAQDSKRPERQFGEQNLSPLMVDEDEIKMVVEWTHAVARHVRLPLIFGHRLLPDY